MSAGPHENGFGREQLRHYLLETLPEAERQALEERLASDEALRALLEETREELRRLDVLPAAEPPAGLADRTLARVTQADAPRPTVWQPRIPAMVFATAAVVLVAALVAVPRAREAAMRASTDSNMKQLALVFKMYAGESRGEMWPPAIPVDGILVPDLRTLYPEFLTNPGILVTEGRAGEADRKALAEALEQEPPDWDAAHRVVARHFVYTGYAFPDPEMVEAFAVAALPPDHGTLRLEDGRTVNRLREGIERFFITDINNPAGSAQAQSTIPVAVHRLRTRDGFTVLYMDGHVGTVSRAVDPEWFEALARLVDGIHPQE